jgi:hypothetical protein
MAFSYLGGHRPPQSPRRRWATHEIKRRSFDDMSVRFSYACPKPVLANDRPSIERIKGKGRFAPVQRSDRFHVALQLATE